MPAINTAIFFLENHPDMLINYIDDYPSIFRKMTDDDAISLLDKVIKLETEHVLSKLLQSSNFSDVVSRGKYNDEARKIYTDEVKKIYKEKLKYQPKQLSELEKRGWDYAFTTEMKNVISLLDACLDKCSSTVAISR